MVLSCFIKIIWYDQQDVFWSLLVQAPQIEGLLKCRLRKGRLALRHADEVTMPLRNFVALTVNDVIDGKQAWHNRWEISKAAGDCQQNLQIVRYGSKLAQTWKYWYKCHRYRFKHFNIKSESYSFRPTTVTDDIRSLVPCQQPATPQADEAIWCEWLPYILANQRLHKSDETHHLGAVLFGLFLPLRRCQWALPQRRRWCPKIPVRWAAQMARFGCRGIHRL